MLARALATAAVLGICASPVAAQSFVRADTSVGGVIGTIAPSAGVFVDASKMVLPGFSVVGGLQVFQSNATELLLLGGVRQLVVRGAAGEAYLEALLGASTGYRSDCGVCGPRITEFGAGGTVALNRRWGVRVRADLRLGGAAGDLFIPMVGAGLVRRW